MIAFRNYLIEDYPKIEAMCNQHKINIPTKAMLIIAENDEKENMEGFIGVTHEAFIEPLICDNPLVAHSLYLQAIDYLKKRGIKSVKLYCDQSKVKLMEKLGFTKFEPDLVFMEKEL